MAIKSQSRSIVLLLASLGMCVNLGASPSRAQSSEVNGINEFVRGAWREGGALIEGTRQSNRAYISGLSCQGLMSQARSEDRAGDYWSAQNLPYSNSRARGHYANVEMIWQEYNRRCN
jgi:hypothetical protein